MDNMTTIHVVSTDNLVDTYSYSSGEWVDKVAKHLRDIYGSNYTVKTDGNKPYWDNIKDKSDKCDVANWWQSHSYTSNQSSNKYLLLISNQHWTAGCRDGGACTMSVGDDLMSVPDPDNLPNFYHGHGYGSGMLNGCIHEVGHTFGMSYNDGYACYDSSRDRNFRSPMAGDATEDSNNCGTSFYKDSSAFDAYSHGYFDPCETDYLPESVDKTFKLQDFPCHDNIQTEDAQ